MSGFYNNNYNKNSGILTLFSKIKDARGVDIGYLLLDTNINSFYNFYNSNDKKPFEDYSVYLMTNENEFLHASFSLPLEDGMINEINNAIREGKLYHISSNKKYLIIQKQVSNCNAVSVNVIPLSGVYIPIIGYAVALTAFCILFLVLSFFFSLVLSRSISIPLNELYHKMQNTISN
jgi:methyl-accepting chemotaxis protein